jgi:hypothetical protein
MEFVFLGFPTTSPRPPIAALFVTLNSVISAEKANGLLGAYDITAEMGEKDARGGVGQFTREFDILPPSPRSSE